MSEEDKPKLPYFHREISEADQALLNRNKPKLIETEGAAESAVEAPSALKLSTASAWNAANSWEERDCSKICYHKLYNAIKNENHYSSLIDLGIIIHADDENVDIDDISGKFLVNVCCCIHQHSSQIQTLTLTLTPNTN